MVSVWCVVVEHVAVAGVVVVVFVVVIVALTMSPPPPWGGLIGSATDNHKYHTPHPLAALANPTAASPPFGGCVCCVLVVLFGKLFMQNLVF